MLKLTYGGMNDMTRCVYLDRWFDAKSKELNAEEEKQKKDLITGEKNE